MKKILVISRDNAINGTIRSVKKLEQTLNIEIVGIVDTLENAKQTLETSYPSIIICDADIYDKNDGFTILDQLLDEFFIPVLVTATDKKNASRFLPGDYNLVGFVGKPMLTRQLELTLEVFLHQDIG